MANDVGFEYRDYTTDGMRAEQEFCNAILNRSPNVVIKHSSEQQDMFEHWDFDIDGVKIDVKARRNIGILNINGDKYTILELVNRNGDDGWLFGKADYIAFEFIREPLKGFLVIPRLELVKYHQAKTQDVFVTDSNDSVNKKYQGFNTKFVITAVSFDEIQMLPNTKFLRK